MTEAATQELPDGSTAEVYLMVPQDAAALNDYIDMHERTSRQPTPLGETGVVLTEKLAELLDVKAGDTVTLVNGDGAEGSFTVSGVCENYVSNYVYMSAATYADAFGQEPEWNNILSRLSDDSQAGPRRDLDRAFGHGRGGQPDLHRGHDDPGAQHAQLH